MWNLLLRGRRRVDRDVEGCRAARASDPDTVAAAAKAEQAAVVAAAEAEAAAAAVAAAAAEAQDKEYEFVRADGEPQNDSDVDDRGNGPTRPEDSSSGSSGGSSAGEASALEASALSLLRQGHPSQLLGFRVEVKWTSGRYYRGTVCGYCPTTDKHQIIYDDGDRRFCFLPETVFRFVREEDEWISVEPCLEV